MGRDGFAGHPENVNDVLSTPSADQHGLLRGA
jgi:hypothetical protein